MGAAGSVFKVSKGSEVKAAKTILPEFAGTDASTFISEIMAGMDVSRGSYYLVHYDAIIEKDYYQCIMMEYFKNGDLLTYLSKGNKLKEEVYFFTSI
jgi:hypothetical protein